LGRIESVNAVEAFMNGRLISALIAGAAAGAAAMPVLAITCYEVIDRNDVVILRGTRAPVDLSSAGAPAREAMRGRGELLVIFNTENCLSFGRATADGSRTFTADEIVAGWRQSPIEVRSGWGTYSSHYGGLLTSGQAPTPTQSP
jgi:hypothetical protein